MFLRAIIAFFESREYEKEETARALHINDFYIIIASRIASSGSCLPRSEAMT